MKLVADDVQRLAIPGVGQWVADLAPDEMLAALTAFLALYLDGEGAGARGQARSGEGREPGG